MAFQDYNLGTKDVIESKFMCPKHSEDKQTEPSELEQKKFYWRAKQGEWAAHAQKAWTPDGFQGRVFIGKILREGCRVHDVSLIGWWWGNRAVLQESCAQSEVTILHLSGDLSFCRRTQRYIVMYILRGGTRTLLHLHFCFLSAPPLFLHSLPSLISNCLNLSFRTQVRSRRPKPFSEKHEMGGRERLLYPGEPYRVLLSFKHAYCYWFDHCF